MIVTRLATSDLNWAIENWVKVSSSIFPNATPIGGMIHAKEECQEVIDELQSVTSIREYLLTEYADIIMCIADSMNRSGIPIADVVFAIMQKTEINKNRKWKDNGNGSYSHVKSLP